jgi:hypothetical protein
MIERLLAAERALDAGQLEVAEPLYGQVEAADPRNAIAMTGRAKVAHAHGDLDGARRHVARALATDPDDQAARALSTALEAPRAQTAGPAFGPRPEPGPAPAPVPPVVRASPSRLGPPPPAPVAAPRRSIVGSVGRFLRRLVGR